MPSPQICNRLRQPVINDHPVVADAGSNLSEVTTYAKYTSIHRAFAGRQNHAVFGSNTLTVVIFETYSVEKLTTWINFWRHLGSVGWQRCRLTNDHLKIRSVTTLFVSGVVGL